MWHAVIDQPYHVASKLVIEKVCGNVCGQEIKENASIAILQLKHIGLFFVGLRIPKKI